MQFFWIVINRNHLKGIKEVFLAKPRFLIDYYEPEKLFLWEKEQNFLLYFILLTWKKV